MNDGELSREEKILEYALEDEVQADYDWIVDAEGEIVNGFAKDIQNEDWMTHFLFKAAPYLALVVMFNWFNIGQNLGPNHFWANENWYMIFNTGFSVFQGFMSFLLIAEMPTYMRLLKPVRAFSMGIAILWNFFYLWAFLELFHDVYKAEGGGHRHVIYDFDTLLLDMMYTFNFAMHGPIWLMNWIIIGYEIKIDVVKADRYRKYELHGNTYNYRLGWSNIIGSVVAVLNRLNPLWWLYRIFFVKYEEEDAELDTYIDQLPSSVEDNLEDRAPTHHWWNF
jgi:hypothetical protein